MALLVSEAAVAAIAPRLDALALVREAYRRVALGQRNAAQAAPIRSELADVATPVIVSDIETAVRDADIVVTVTPAKVPVIQHDWIKPGARTSEMGADRVGKAELDPRLFARRVLVADWAEQARAIGEFQHAPPDLLGELFGPDRAPRAPDGPTIFDSSSLSVQDLLVAEHAVRLAVEEGRCQEIDL